MPEAMSVLATSASPTAPVRKTYTPGPGNFISDGGRWKAIMRPRYHQEPDPINPERKIDVADLDEHGNVIMIPDPAAMRTLESELGSEESKIGKPVMVFPEPNNEAKRRMDEFQAHLTSMQEILVKNVEAQSKMMEAIVRLVDQHGRPIRRGPGRPPKEE